MNKNISVIITAWDNDLYLKECLDSVLYQDIDPDYEILLGIDNCEKTKAKFIALRNANTDYNRIKAYYMKENKGTYITSNTLISLSSNKVLLRFDSDDVMTEDMLSSIYNNIEDNDLLRFSCAAFTDDIKINTPGREGYFPDGVCAFTKTIYNILGGYRSWRCSADSDFRVRMMHISKKIKSITDILFYRRVHPNSLTTSKDTCFGSEYRENCRKAIEHRFIKIKPEINTFEII